MALVLSRKAGESIRIGNDVIVKVNRISGGRVSLAIEAPEHVKIVREELKQHREPTEKTPAPICTLGPMAAYTRIAS